jgi:hypothetical protein
MMDFLFMEIPNPVTVFKRYLLKRRLMKKAMILLVSSGVVRSDRTDIRYYGWSKNKKIRGVV